MALDSYQVNVVRCWMRSTTKTTSKVLLSVLCRSFCVLSVVHLGIQAAQHRPQQVQFRRRVMVLFVNEDFARSEEILNADTSAKHPQLYRCLARYWGVPEQ